MIKQKTQKLKGITMKLREKEIKVTNHFVERYYERIFRSVPPKMGDRNRSFKMKKIQKVLNDISIKISDRDKTNLLFLKSCKHAKVPFNNHLIVLSQQQILNHYCSL